MVSSNERIFIIGATGNIGSKAVQDLLANNVRVTLFTRNQEKVKLIFSGKSHLIDIVEGDYDDMSPLKEGLKGHTRLFVVLGKTQKFVEIKQTIADYAYEAGIQQIVDLSSAAVNSGYRTSLSGSAHYYGEKAFYEHPKRSGKVVILRPSRLMSNAFWLDNVKKNGVLRDAIEPDFRQDYISTDDIGAIVANILQDDIQKHGEPVYTLIGDVISNRERAAVFSEILGQDISFEEVPAAKRCEELIQIGLPFEFAVSLADPLDYTDLQRVTPVTEILLNRKPETFREFIERNKTLVQ
ncbi:hypothetical protein BD560DRAFT_27136 [Blakeslea trispora]|nr:hypothetical protein BD560DRAFT_27136 [Blakeslea trispora]